ncbi:hypothetical protein TrRE_jg8521, partial [Triparma retinervis]
MRTYDDLQKATLSPDTFFLLLRSALNFWRAFPTPQGSLFGAAPEKKK